MQRSSRKARPRMSPEPNSTSAKSREIAGIYDINFCLNGKRGELHHAATLSEPKSRRSTRSVDDRAWRPALYLAAFLGALDPIWRHRARAADLARCAEPAGFSLCDLAPRRTISAPHRMAVLARVKVLSLRRAASAAWGGRKAALNPSAIGDEVLVRASPRLIGGKEQRHLRHVFGIELALEALRLHQGLLALGRQPQ